MLPSPYNSYQQQVADLQQKLGALQQSPLVPHDEPKQILRVPGIAEAKAFSKERLNPGDAAVLFDENEDVFYFVSKSKDGIAQPLMLGRFTLEPEPPKPEYVTKQDFESLKTEILKLLKKENKA